MLNSTERLPDYLDSTDRRVPHVCASNALAFGISGSGRKQFLAVCPRSGISENNASMAGKRVIIQQ